MKYNLRAPVQLLTAACLLGVASLPSVAQTCELVIDLNTIGTKGSNPTRLHTIGGSSFLFVANDGVSGSELYRWDPVQGVSFLRDIYPGILSSSATWFSTGWFAGQQRTLFAADDGHLGKELWSTDGTAAGTALLVDISTQGGSDPNNLIYLPAHGVVYFEAWDPVHGSELWTSDATAAGTALLVDLAPGYTSFGMPIESNPKELSALGDRLMFSAWDPVAGRELFVSDGTQLGTGMLIDLAPGADLFGDPNESSPHDFLQFGSQLVFLADDGVHGEELFITDGTASGTQLLKDIRPGSMGSDVNDLTVYDGKVYFSANDGTNGFEMWRTDGTPAGTAMAFDLDAGSGSAAPQHMTSAGDGRLYFSARASSTTGRELYVSNGTLFGTYMVSDLNPGPSSSEPASFTPVSNGVYFSARSGNGTELFFSDGTGLGTFEVCDLYPGLASGAPSELTLCGGELFFQGVAPLVGAELFRIVTPGAYVQDLGQGAWGLELGSTDPILGLPLSFDVQGAPSGGLGLLLASTHTASPLALLGSAAGLFWLDPSTLWIQSSVSGPSWSQTQVLPASPGLAGAQLNLQAWFPPLPGSPEQLSNGLQLVLGS